MKPLRLIRIAAEAEQVRLLQGMRRALWRVGLVGAFVVFALGGVIMGHAATWFWLRAGDAWSESATALLIGVGDAVMAILLVVATIHWRAGSVETQALAVRRTACDGILDAIAVPETVVAIIRVATAALRR